MKRILFTFVFVILLTGCINDTKEDVYNDIDFSMIDCPRGYLQEVDTCVEEVNEMSFDTVTPYYYEPICDSNEVLNMNRDECISSTYVEATSKTISEQYIRTGYFLNSYEIVVHPGVFCQTWGGTNSYNMDEYTLMYQNTCVRLGGGTYFDVNGRAVSLNYFFEYILEYDEEDMESYEYIGFEFIK